MPVDTAAPPANAGFQPGTMPMFYRQPMPLDPKRHGGHGFVPLPSHAFAKGTNCIPILGGEMAAAQRHYPIIFSAAERPVPVAVVGIRDKENLFVDGFGRWKENTYIPTYVRRYPFIFSQMPESGKFALCIDEASGCLVQGGGQAMFDNGQPSELIKGVLRFCGEFQQEFERTQQFCQALKANNLLVERSMQLKSPTGQTAAMSGFYIVDESKLGDLPESVVMDWLKRGWLGLIYAHLMSTNSWREIATMAAMTPATTG